MSVSTSGPRIVALSIGYAIGEMIFDGAIGWIIYSHGHPWWTLVWCMLAGVSANRSAKRYAGHPSEEPGTV